MVDADFLPGPRGLEGIRFSNFMVDDICRANMGDRAIPEGSLYLSFPVLYQCPPILTARNYNPTVDVINNQVMWDFNDGYAPEYSEHSTSKGERETHQFYTSRHDIVANALGMQETDIQLKHVFGPIPPEHEDHCDHLTPDYVHEAEDGTIFVMELATTRSHNQEGVAESFMNKQVKYQYALERRARLTNKKVVYWVLVISPNSLRTTMRLPRWVMYNLFYRMRMATVIEDLAIALGVPVVDDATEIVVRCQEITNSYEKLKLDWLTERQPFKISKRDVIPYSREMTMGEKEVVLQQMHIMVREGAKQAKAVPTTAAKARSSLTKVSDGVRTRTIPKPLTALPLMVVMPEDQPHNTFFAPYIHTDDESPSIAQVWGEAFDCVSGTEEDFPLEDDTGEAGLYEVYTRDDEEPVKSAYKHKYRRVDLNLPLNLQVYLATKGVEGKRFKDNPYVIDALADSRLRWDPSVDTSDIDEFLNDPSWGTQKLEGPTSLDRIKDILEIADSLQGNEGEYVGTVGELLKTKMARALDINSEIAQELAISYRQHTQRGQFILKKLRNYPIFLLIKPTNLRGHIFFSICVKKVNLVDSYGLPFPQMISHGEYCFTSFRSFTTTKLPNQFVMTQLWIGALTRWIVLHNGNLSPEALLHPDPHVTYMANLLTLVGMEDKAEVEAEMTNSRFMYMELFKSNTHGLSQPDPLKMVSKFNPFPRSRMTIWVQHKLINGFSAMMREPPKLLPSGFSTLTKLMQQMEERQEECSIDDMLIAPDYEPLPAGLHPRDLSREKWDGLFNVYTMKPVSNLEAIVNIMYTGYFKDKNQNSWENSDWKLVEKVLEEELKIDKTRVEFYGLFEPPMEDVRDHEFSPAAIKYGCQAAKLELMRKYGPNYKDVVADKICHSLARVSMDTVATLKASSTIGVPSELILESQDDLEHHAGRIKCLEAASSTVDEYGTFPFRNIDKIVKRVRDSYSGVACDLFKKNQHAGLREIYVLEFSSRLVQLFIERSGRTLCEEFQIDTLSHPENKTRLIDEHYAQVGQVIKATNGIAVSGNSSNDKTRWNQNIMVRAFSLIFFQLLPGPLAEALSVCLNLWYGKIIKLPPGVQRLLITNTHLSSEVYEVLLESFWGGQDREDILMEDHKKFFRTMSGMFQGILHYTSSLLHVIERLAYKRLAELYFDQAFTSQGARYGVLRVVITVMCCSDDSATLITVLLNRGIRREELDDVEKAVQVMLHSQSYHGRLCNMRESVKSTIGTTDVIEYNSTFMCKGNVAVPTVKFWEAAVKMTQTESIKARQDGLYNVLRSLAENGAPSCECRVAQILQAMVFYKTLGSDINPFFPRLKESLMDTHNVDLGFFTTDPELCPGILGHDYCTYMVARNGRHRKNLHYLYTLGAIDCSKSGILMTGATLNFGSRKRLMTLQEKVDTVDDWEEILNADPRCLYQKPSTVLECKLIMSALAHSSGVHESLNRGNSFLNCISSSVYAAQKPCITVRQVQKDNDGKYSGSMVKTTLINAVKIAANEDIQDSEVPLHLMFPAMHMYEEIRDLLLKLSAQKRYIPIKPLRKKNVKLIFYPLGLDQNTSLRSCARHTWFGTEVRGPSRALMISWANYKQMIPWLRDDVQDTLKESPFDSHIALRNFIDGHEKQARTTRLVCHPVSGATYINQLEEYIRNNSNPGHRLTGVVDVEYTAQGFGVNIDLESLIRQISLVLLFPIGADDKLECIVDVFGAYKIPRYSNEILSKMPGYMAYMAVMSWVGREAVRLQDYGEFDFSSLAATSAAVDALRGLRGTVVDYVVLPQQRDNEGKPIGRGTTNIQVQDLRATLYYTRDEISRIVVNNLDEFCRNKTAVLEFLKHTQHHTTQQKGSFSVACVAKLNGAVVYGPDAIGTPILVVPNDVNWHMSVDSVRLYLQVRGDTLALMADQKVSIVTGEISVLRQTIPSSKSTFYRPRQLCQFTPNAKLDLSHQAWEKSGKALAKIGTGVTARVGLTSELSWRWVNVESADSVALSTMVEELIKYREQVEANERALDEDIEDVIRWYRYTFKTRMAHKYSVVPAPAADAASAPSEDIAIFKATEDSLAETKEFFSISDGSDFNAFWADDPFEGVDFSGTYDASDHMESMMDDQIDDDMMFAGIESYAATLMSEYTSTTTKNLLVGTHPFWDDYSEEAQTYCRNCLRDIAEGKPINSIVLQRQLAFLFEKRIQAPKGVTRLAAYLQELEREQDKGVEQRRPVKKSSKLSLSHDGGKYIPPHRRSSDQEAGPSSQMTRQRPRVVAKAFKGTREQKKNKRSKRH